MTPPKQDHPTWNSLTKITMSVLGAVLISVIGWAAKAAERQADAFEKLKDAVYRGQTKTEVLETKIDGLENKTQNIDNRVRTIEARLLQEKK